MKRIAYINPYTKPPAPKERKTMAFSATPFTSFQNRHCGQHDLMNITYHFYNAANQRTASTSLEGSGKHNMWNKHLLST